jgi:hypothetical protein
MDQTKDPMHVQEPLPKPPEGMSPIKKAAIILGVLLAVAIILAILLVLMTHPGVTSTLSDIAIITVSLVTIVIGLFLAILIFQLQALISLLRNDIKPILESTKETVGTVRGTTSFVSENVVSPMINAMSVGAGIAQTARSLVRGPNGRRKRTHKS